jgi:hypothetical protein
VLYDNFFNMDRSVVGLPVGTVHPSRSTDAAAAAVTGSTISKLSKG